MSSRIDAVHRVPPGGTFRATARARVAPFISAAFAGAILVLVGLFLYQTGTFEPAPPKPVQQPDIPSDQVTVADSTITGLDRQNQPYSISAKSAVQDKDKPNFINLDEVIGASNRANGELITFRSRTGLYNSDAKTLDLVTDVVVRSAGRFTANMERAQVVVGEKRLTSDSPVTVELATGTIKANGVEITNDGNNIRFLNGVRAHFRNTKSQGDSP